MLVNYIIISIRYFRHRRFEGIVNLTTATLAMSLLLIGLALYLHGMPVAPAIALLICSVGLLFSLGNSVESRQYRNKKELEIRYTLGAEVTDLYQQVFIEALLITSLGSFVAIALLDILMTFAPLTQKMVAREILFDYSTLVAFLVSIPTLTLITAIYPTLNLLSVRRERKLNR